MTTLSLALACLALTFSLAVRAEAQTLTYLANFNGFDGEEPNGSLSQGLDGNFYGVSPTNITSLGAGAGSVFKVTPEGELSTFYGFCSNCMLSPYPHGNPTLAGDGNFYGVVGQVFYRLTPAGEFTPLYTFCVDEGCPGVPDTLILASDGNFYGTSAGGGSTLSGEIVRLSPTGEFKLMHTFCSLSRCADGYSPSALIQANDGNFYGATSDGGVRGGGVIYQMTPSGSYKVLLGFCNSNNRSCPDGSNPSSLVQDADGNFFGTTAFGGEFNGGVFFEMTSTRQFSALHNFGYADALTPGDLILASDGNFYGLASVPGRDVWSGTIFRMTPAGEYNSLYTFVCCQEGYHPNGPLLQATDGSFYGTTLYGPGVQNPYGTVFKLSNGIGPLVATVPLAGKVGKKVLILGNGLTGTTSVTFNGVAAAFTVESDTYIKATVPAGATTGTVSVVTPSGTLNSNPQFVVTK